ncbi:MAG: DNA internalization-related competence protein ComEC/Rec2 [Thiotrichales bacterium]|nr:MAG: DNA internalization-related competence protein ComEC/Rec2 [Thiotrichales bacterium]
MFLDALYLLAGILSLNLFAQLPGVSLYLACTVSLLVCRVSRTCSSTSLCRAVAVFLFGISWAQMHATGYLQHVLPESLAGTDIVITGQICDIPVRDQTVQRFVVQIEEFSLNGYAGKVPERLKLSWYYGEAVAAGETWQLTVRLKPPHGFMNPGGFDYEAWLFQHGIHATGYVRNGADNKKLQTATVFDSVVIRQQTAENIQSVLHDSVFAGLVRALAVGDRSGINRDQWEVLINTGTNHLVAISGLHIGLAAAFGYALSRRLVPLRVMYRIPAQHVAILCAVLVATIYAMLAGFAIPTQRALIMLICVAAAALLKRTSRPMDVLGVALIVILLWDPAAVMSAGFWFSFLAVAVIFYTLTGNKIRFRWLQWGQMQIVIALALLPMSLFMFQQTSLVSPLANLFMVPYVSLLVVPLILLGMLLLPLSDIASAFLLGIAAHLFELIWPLLQGLSGVPYSHWIRAQPGMLLMIPAFAGVAVLLSPGLGYSRIAGVVLLLPLLVSQPESPPPGAYELTVLDVGQGLAAVVRTHSHTLVYDTGARFSERLDSGEAVLLPFLRHEGVGRIDLLVISHGDGDHIGGAVSLLREFPETPLLGQGIDQLDAVDSKDCEAGQTWEWDDVRFTIIHPDQGAYTSSNNRSCVLKIETRGGSTLLTGDIEKKIENRLLRRDAARLAADILIAPHHGSKTSSTPAFVTAVSPRIVIFAAGYRNRYRFPHRDVVSRYDTAGATAYISGHSGAITLSVDAESGPGEVRSYRRNQGKYWNHRPSGLRQDG